MISFVSNPEEMSLMPYDNIEKETDGNPLTIYEDPSVHERRGYIRDESHKNENDEVNNGKVATD